VLHTWIVPGGRARRSWAIAAVVAAVWGVLAAVGAVARAAAGDRFEAVLALGYARASYWFAAGAWRRTPWGHVEGEDPLPGPPPLTAARVTRYALVALVASVAIVVAFTVQMIDGHWLD